MDRGVWGGFTRICNSERRRSRCSIYSARASIGTAEIFFGRKVTSNYLIFNPFHVPCMI
jgi:hypothetical protein